MQRLRFPRQAKVPVLPGHAPHHYTITIIATDIAPGSLKPGLTRDELQTALKGHALDSATIVGRYGRP